MKTLPAIHPNPGLRQRYAKELTQLLRAMSKDFMRNIERVYRKHEAQIAMDAAPVAELQTLINTLMKRWSRRWDKAAERVATWFVESVRKQTGYSLDKALRDAGFTFKRSDAVVTDVVAALIQENVNLIKSIPQQYHTDITGIVMRAVSTGEDVKYISQQLTKRYNVEENRAKLIARDQTNKATQAITQSRDRDLGVTEGIWVHLPGLKTSRKTHKAMNNKTFKLAEGMYDSSVKRKVKPAELPYCQCIYRAVIPEFLDDKKE
jgi:uncharacterized protein with gpF-like domain